MVILQLHTATTMPGPASDRGVSLALLPNTNMFLNAAWFHFRGADRAIKMEVVQRVAVEGGQAATIRLR